MSPLTVASILDGRVSEFYNKAMKPSTPFLRRDVVEIKPWAETCGQIRPLIEEQDGAAAEVHHLEITDAKLHYHERTDEIYYVLDGEGRMQLDDAEIELHKDVTVYVPRGVKHRAWGNLKVLVVCIPRGVLNDVHEVE
jgi:mannose-6-phosphate isomerase-like protein (cupin superfamily)